MTKISTSRTIFITGTDTGVGKTLLTALLLADLRRRGICALAIKPFCTGGRGDARLLNRVQDHCLGLDEINPFHFAEPVAPLVAARKQRCRIHLSEVLDRIAALRKSCECLLVEGVGGLMVPLGDGYSIRELAAALDGEIMLVGPNRLGVINHIILTVHALQAIGVQNIKTVLMDQKNGGLAACSNPEILRELLAPRPVFQVPFLGIRAKELSALKKIAKKIEKTLAEISGIDRL
jgi:dethiobiotin synthetase